MKKIIILAIMLTSVVSCNKYNYQISDNCYTIYKITRIHGFYGIYAQKGKLHYVISSKVEKSDTGTKIVLGGCYNFNLKSRTDHLNETFGLKSPTLGYGNIGCTRKIFREIVSGKITDIYYSNNLKGLYYIEQ